MQFKSFLIPVSGNDRLEAELNAFLRSHRVVAVSREFINNYDNSFWAFLVEFIDDKGSADEKIKGAVDYKDILNENDFKLFSFLRDERKKIAQKFNVPVYVVFTNAELSEIAERKPTSLGALKKISGIGKSKAEKYGEAILEALNSWKSEYNFTEDKKE